MDKSSKDFLIIGILCILIDGAVIFSAFVRKSKLTTTVCPSASFTTNKPVVGAFSLTGHSDILGWFWPQDSWDRPNLQHIADKLECIIIFCIVFGHISSHLQRTVHHEVKSQLTHNVV